jgi:hypothetical protein
MPSDAEGGRAKVFRVGSFLLLLSVCLCYCTLALGPKGLEFTEKLNGFKLAWALSFPLLGFWCVRARFKTERFWALLSSDFIVSLIPTAIIVWACTRACFVLYVCHIFESDSRKISVGMTQEQVIQTLGQYRGGGGDSGPPWEYLDWDLQRPFGYELTQFHVRFVNGKVVSTTFRNPLSVDAGPP